MRIAPEGRPFILGAAVIGVIFVLLGWLRWKAHMAGLAALLVAILVAIFAFQMPAGLALLSATEGAAFGLFPITWIVLTAVGAS